METDNPYTDENFPVEFQPAAELSSHLHVMTDTESLVIEVNERLEKLYKKGQSFGIWVGVFSAVAVTRVVEGLRQAGYDVELDEKKQMKVTLPK